MCTAHTIRYEWLIIESAFFCWFRLLNERKLAFIQNVCGSFVVSVRWGKILLPVSLRWSELFFYQSKLFIKRNWNWIPYRTATLKTNHNQFFFLFWMCSMFGESHVPSLISWMYISMNRTHNDGSCGFSIVWECNIWHIENSINKALDSSEVPMPLSESEYIHTKNQAVFFCFGFFFSLSKSSCRWQWTTNEWIDT